MHHARSVVLPREPGSARRARHLLLEALAAAGEDLVARAGIGELLVSELATNAVRYGQGEDFRVDLDLRPGVLRVEVHDRSRVVPVPRHASPVEVGGRGLRLVDALASTWGAEETEDGKVVWFTLAAEDRAPLAP